MSSICHLLHLHWLNYLFVVDPNEDQFEKRKKAKKERVAKNELQRLRNIARSQKSKGT